MNILIAGGAGTFLNNILDKLHKEGHRVSVLTGNRFADKNTYAKCFEVYKFNYDATCLNEIFDSVAPDVTIFMGAYDTNFDWKNEEADSVRYSASLANILMSYTMRGTGRFIYMSSDEVYGDTQPDVLLSEDSVKSPDGFRALAISQGEEVCDNYRKNRNLDIVTLRFDHLYGIPHDKKEVLDCVSKMCFACLDVKSINFDKDYTISVTYENDAIEALYKIIVTASHDSDVYNISSSTPITEEELADKVRDIMDHECETFSITVTVPKSRMLSNERFGAEFYNPRFTPVDNIIEKIASTMKKRSYVFLVGEEADISLGQKLKKKLGWFFKAIFPFIENLIVFIPVFMLNNRAVGSDYFGKLDIYLLYVLLFAMVYGQQQATFSALLAVAGYFFRQTYDRTGFELLMDANTYVWVAQLFIVGLSVGYIKDSIDKLKKENEEERQYLETQIDDIQSINGINVRVKGVLETQIVNQSDSVGKIYGITSALDQYEPEEVLFYAAEVVGKVLKTDDVAIYTVSNGDYARLFSSTSKRARSLGNSIKYTEMGELYNDISSRKVYINKRMDAKYPLMAHAIYSEDRMQMIVLLWGLSWENMTLAQSNQLVVVSSLIQNAVIRANKYLEVLEDKRYSEGSRLLAADSFNSLLKAYIRAESKGLTECTILRVLNTPNMPANAPELIQKSLRNTDYFGRRDDGMIYIILSNTGTEDSKYVLNRLENMNFTCEICKELAG